MHDIVDMTDGLKKDSLPIHLGPQRWSSFATAAPLAWSSVPWDLSQKQSVPEVRGIYAFTVQFGAARLPSHGYVLYVGITGAGTSAGTLRSRFASYFRERERYNGRNRVGYILNKWEKHLVFQFAEVPDPSFDLEDLEKRLCDAIIPYASRNDLTARVRKGKDAAGL